MPTYVRKMNITNLAIPDVKLIVPLLHKDERGFFVESWSKANFEKHGLSFDFVQDNQSLSVHAGTIRGLHFQTPPFAQTKLIRVLRGRILDVAVDLRKSSSTYGQWVSAELSPEKGEALLVPKGFAHGFCTLEPMTEVFYKVDAPYAPAHDAGLIFNDPEIGINWPIAEDKLHLSNKDRALPLLKNLGTVFE
jgi:dTDP-4-dehydrorhamnose 3,5-epimerase